MMTKPNNNINVPMTWVPKINNAMIVVGFYTETENELRVMAVEDALNFVIPNI